MQLTYQTYDGRPAAHVLEQGTLLIDVGALHLQDVAGGPWRQFAYYSDEGSSDGRRRWRLEEDCFGATASLASPSLEQDSLRLRSVAGFELWSKSGDDDSFDLLVASGHDLLLASAHSGLGLDLDGQAVAYWDAEQDPWPADVWTGSNGLTLSGLLLARSLMPVTLELPEIAPLGPRQRLSTLATRS